VTGAAIGLSGALVVCAWLLLPEDGGAVAVQTALQDAAAGATLDASAGTASAGDALPLPGSDGAARLDPSAVPLPEAPAGRGMLVIRALWATDRQPAPGVELEVTAWDEPDRDARTRTVRTDADGQVGFREVAAGFVTVDAPRGGKAGIDVLADGTTELELLVSDDLLVRGRVLDADGRPAPDASVWVSLHPSTTARGPWSREPADAPLPPRLDPVEGPVDSTRGRIGARTGAGGRFLLKGLAPGQAVAALHELAAPSPLLVLADPETHELEVTLQLGPPGAALTGRVVDPAGAPVAHTVVYILGEPASRRAGCPECAPSRTNEARSPRPACRRER
jgi:hypothetical protein